MPEERLFPFRAILALEDLLRQQWQRAHAPAHRTETIAPWVFHRQGAPIGDFRKAWATACVAAGTPGRMPHDFRRTAVRNLERAGVPRAVAMKLTGHKTESVSRRYAIVRGNLHWPMSLPAQSPSGGSSSEGVPAPRGRAGALMGGDFSSRRARGIPRAPRPRPGAGRR